MVVDAQIDARVCGVRLVQLDARIEIVPSEQLPIEPAPVADLTPARFLEPAGGRLPQPVGSSLTLAGALLAQAEDVLEDAQQVHVQLTRIAAGRPASI